MTTNVVVGGGDGCDDNNSEEALGAADDVYEGVENEIDGRVVEEVLVL